MSQYPMVKIDYRELLKKYPWVVKYKQNCILSPDSDGLLCGLLMSHYLNWRICGFYDGKVLVTAGGINPKRMYFSGYGDIPSKHP